MNRIDLADLGLDRGGHLILRRALARLGAGERAEVVGRDPALAVHLRAWCRAHGHDFDGPSVVTRGRADRWDGAESTGDPDRVVESAPARWGLAARGSTVEAGAPEIVFPLSTRAEVWAEEAGRIYRQAAAQQWDPDTAIRWEAPYAIPDEVEDAVVQVMTYLIENETAALLVSARFAAQVHPHFREVMQLLAINAADEARHIEVFTRRALLRRPRLGSSTAGGQASLATLVEEPDFAQASFLLSVLGEGTFLSLLWFLHEHAPDPVTADVARLAAQDEARHVAFGMAHLERHAREDPSLLERLAKAIERRHDHLQHTAGLNEEVFDALILLAAGGWEVDAIRRGWDRVQVLETAMDEGRKKRLARLGFGTDQSAALSALHTKNFM